MHLDELLLLRDVRSGGTLDAGSPRGVLVWTPLQFACALGDEPLVRSLLVEHADELVSDAGKTKYSYTPLHIAVHFGHAAIVKLLLAHSSATINPVDAQIGASALHVAVLSGNVEVVRALLDANAAHTPTKNGTTPLEVAAELGLSEIHQLLTDAVAKAAGKEQISNWLASIGMIEYVHNFWDAGFDDAAFLLANGLSDVALDGMQIQKPGHRLKLQSLYQLRESIPELADVESSSSEGEDEDSEEEKDSSSDEDNSNASSNEGDSGSESESNSK